MMKNSEIEHEPMPLSDEKPIDAVKSTSPPPSLAQTIPSPPASLTGKQADELLAQVMQLRQKVMPSKKKNGIPIKQHRYNGRRHQHQHQNHRPLKALRHIYHMPRLDDGMLYTYFEAPKASERLYDVDEQDAMIRTILQRSERQSQLWRGLLCLSPLILSSMMFVLLNNTWKTLNFHPHHMKKHIEDKWWWSRLGGIEFEHHLFRSAFAITLSYLLSMVSYAGSGLLVLADGWRFLSKKRFFIRLFTLLSAFGPLIFWGLAFFHQENENFPFVLLAVGPLMFFVFCSIAMSDMQALCQQRKELKRLGYYFSTW
jgi:hypothetical protein